MIRYNMQVDLNAEELRYEQPLENVPRLRATDIRLLQTVHLDARHEKDSNEFLATFTLWP
jgi:hypothetical protein